ncbi:MAG: 3-methyl-2-oxobutanoate hydroxymethyltransferase [Rhizobiaceae bacterium]|nr:3-methyl-2-oxobutanoate hydroxymethyltransferase [Rhizobiaceae bacterium]
MTNRKPPTVADILANKGKHQYAKLRVTTWDELAAAEAAGIELCSVPPEMLESPRFREVAPSVFAIPGMALWELDGPTDDALRWAFRMVRAGANAVYCAASFQTVRRMADEGIPVIGHVGLIPHTCTWTGGFKAVGKTAESAMKVFERVKRYEEAGAFGLEIEVMPPDIAAEISRRTPLFMISMGSGSDCDANYLFAEDVLGENRGHVPKHAKIYRNFAAEYDRLQAERIAAFREFRQDVESRAFPEPAQAVKSVPGELERFREMLAAG